MLMIRYILRFISFQLSYEDWWHRKYQHTITPKNTSTSVYWELVHPRECSYFILKARFLYTCVYREASGRKTHTRHEKVKKRKYWLGVSNMPPAGPMKPATRRRAACKQLAVSLCFHDKDGRNGVSPNNPFFPIHFSSKRRSALIIHSHSVYYTALIRLVFSFDFCFPAICHFGCTNPRTAGATAKEEAWNSRLQQVLTLRYKCLIGLLL